MVFAFVVKRGLVTSRLFSCWRWSVLNIL
jgi:hypothetical protein